MKPLPPGESVLDDAVPLKRAKSKGEKLFDRAVYGGLAGAATFLLTVPVTYLLKHHSRVKPHFENAVESIHRCISHIFPSIEKKTSEMALTTLALMQGGNIMLLPIAWAEKHKVKIVSGLNVMFGDKTSPELIEQVPPQTFWSLTQSRLMAFAAVFAAFKGVEKVVPETLKTFEHEIGSGVCKLFEKPIEREGVVSMNGKQALGKMPTKTYLFGKIGALDIFATIAAATLLYIGGHFFARKQAEKKANPEPRHKLFHVGSDEAAKNESSPQPIGPASEISGIKAHEGQLSEARTAQLAHS